MPQLFALLVMPFRLKDNVSLRIKQGSGKPFQMVIPTAMLAIERMSCANLPYKGFRQ